MATWRVEAIMNPFALVAVACALALGATPTLAQDRHRGGDGRGYHRDGGHWGGGRGHFERRWAGPRFYPRHFYSYIYPTPLFGFYDPYPFYVPLPAPAYVERYRVYGDDDDDFAPPPPRREYRERSQAQNEPPPWVPPPAPAPAAQPRLERQTLSARELFAFDQSALRAPQPRLDEIARALRDNPRIDHVAITGYTDRLGSDAYNRALSQRRADAVKQYLVGQGVEARRLDAVGKGKANPVVQCNDQERAKLIQCLEPNRRVEVEQITVERRVAPAPR
jgi:outer membrane protein OmpA-like peptidoglycan-associated protein